MKHNEGYLAGTKTDGPCYADQVCSTAATDNEVSCMTEEVDLLTTNHSDVPQSAPLTGAFADVEEVIANSMPGLFASQLVVESEFSVAVNHIRIDDSIVADESVNQCTDARR
jgi:hypothetical protein